MWKSLRKSLTFWLGLFFAVAGFLFLWGAIQVYQNHQRILEIMDHGTAVVKKEHRTRSDGTEVYTIEYKLEGPYATQHSWLSEVPFAEWQKLQEGQSVPVKPLLSLSNTTPFRRGYQDDWWRDVLVNGCLGALLALGGAGTAGLTARRCWIGAELTRTGMRTTGIVTGVAFNPSLTINDHHPWYLTYRFEAAGKSIVGKSSYLPFGDEKLWTTGSQIEVAYNPSKPQQNVAILSKNGD